MSSLSRLSHTAIAATWRGELVLDTVLSKTGKVSTLACPVLSTSPATWSDIQRSEAHQPIGGLNYSEIGYT
jgi:hypothetical protein